MIHHLLNLNTYLSHFGLFLIKQCMCAAKPWEGTTIFNSFKQLVVYYYNSKEKKVYNLIWWMNLCLAAPYKTYMLSLHPRICQFLVVCWLLRISRCCSWKASPRMCCERDCAVSTRASEWLSWSWTTPEPTSARMCRASRRKWPSWWTKLSVIPFLSGRYQEHLHKH